MKLKIALFLSGLFFLVSLVNAQQQFTASNSYRVNASAKLGFAVYIQSFESIVPLAGTNYTWDFRSANWPDPVTPYLFQASSASQHNVFYHTEINEYSNILFGRNHFYTYSAGRDTLYFDGFYSATNYLYRPRIPYLTFPLNFGDSVYTHTRQYALPTQPSTATGSITRYWIYDGYGTLQLPYGTVSDVYRIRTRQIDSSYVLNNAVVYDEMIWFRQDGIPVLRLLKNATIISAYFASAGSSGISDDFAKSEDIRVYPNPAKDRVSLLAEEKYKGSTYRLLDQYGRLIRTGTITRVNMEIDLGNLSPGIYYLTMDRALIPAQKFIKE